MKIFNNNIFTGLLFMATCYCFTACNKAPLTPVPLAQPVPGTSPTLANLLDNPDSSFTFLKAAVVRAGLLPALSAPSLRYTVFAPNNAAFMASGIPSVGVVNSLPVATLTGLLSYHVIPQTITSASIPTSFPNFEYPTILNPTGTPGTTGYNALARLTNFPSRRGSSAWVNTIPITALDIPAVNGVLHKVAALVAPPPTKSVWDTISSSADLTYLRAAIIRADSGSAVATSLQTALSTFGANLTVLAPVDAAVRQFLIASITQALIPIVTQQLIAAGATPAQAAAQAPVLALSQANTLAGTPAVFSNPLLFGPLSAQTVKGLIVYHVLGITIPGIRVFSVNMPTTATPVKTLLNQAIAVHPGVTIRATFTGPFVTAATVKGLGNATASNIIFPADINMLNGIMHKIDQILIPQ